MSLESDITRNLPSLQFQSAFDETDGHYLHLRIRSYILTVAACAQATYFISVLNELRQVVLEEYSSRVVHRPSSSRILNTSIQRDPVKVGIIGCGRLGRQLATSLLAFAGVRPEELFISTRRPELLQDLAQRGVWCSFDNQCLCNKVNVLFICCLPSQFGTVAKDIQSFLLSNTIVYSLVGATTIDRILQSLRFDNVIRPEFSWATNVTERNLEKHWNTSKDIIQALYDSRIIASCCPLSLNKEEDTVNTSEQWAEVIIMAFINMCTELKVSKNDSVKLCNQIILGLQDNSTEEHGFVIEDLQAVIPNDQIISKEDNITSTNTDRSTKLFPIFNFKLAYFSHTHIGYKVCYEGIRKNFIKNFSSKFGKVKVWKGYRSENLTKN
ncbi:NADP-dependent oxidoreductase domain-containing protein 1 [Trichoplax sp. H2]|nr:NADP-dependent oxidoreductase domain-containing protein 1 [Trichoplax sp. H2]|eukprot:RDD44387.1 NADP-dependent oxidoreductase domain-containing protein 1 [Trichoplax sp. H2]